MKGPRKRFFHLCKDPPGLERAEVKQGQDVQSFTPLELPVAV